MTLVQPAALVPEPGWESHAAFEFERGVRSRSRVVVGGRRARVAAYFNDKMIPADVAHTAEERSEHVLETGLTYDGISPVRVRVTKRDGRFEFSDDGGAVVAAGVDPEQFSFADRIVMGEFSANVSRHGVVWLPGVASSSDDWLAKLPRLVAEGSLALYVALLELDD